MSHDEYENCLDACLQCARECTRYTYVIRHAKQKAEFIALCRKCAELCSLVADNIKTKSKDTAVNCAWCAALCEVFMNQCKKYTGKQNQKCIDASRRCVIECRKIM